jgi:hypothetical protein
LITIISWCRPFQLKARRHRQNHNQEVPLCFPRRLASEWSTFCPPRSRILTSRGSSRRLTILLDHGPHTLAGVRTQAQSMVLFHRYVNNTNSKILKDLTVGGASIFRFRFLLSRLRRIGQKSCLSNTDDLLPVLVGHVCLHWYLHFLWRWLQGLGICNYMPCASCDDWFAVKLSFLLTRKLSSVEISALSCHLKVRNLIPNRCEFSSWTNRSSRVNPVSKGTKAIWEIKVACVLDAKRITTDSSRWIRKNMITNAIFPYAP